MSATLLEGALAAAHRQIRVSAGLSDRGGPGGAALVHLDMPRWFHGQEPLPQLRVLAEALRLRRKLALDYRRAGWQGGPARSRVAAPLGLVNKAGTWYLVVLAADQRITVLRAARVSSARLRQVARQILDRYGGAPDFAPAGSGPCTRVSSVIEVRAATEHEAAAWRKDWRLRLQSWYAHPDVTAQWADQQVEQRLANRDRAAVASTFALTADGAVVGYLALATTAQGGGQTAMVSDVWVAEPHRRHGYASAALRWAESWARSHSADSIWVLTSPAEPAHAGLFAGYQLRAQQMIKKLSGPWPLPDGLTGRPMTEDEFTAWREQAVRGYAADIAASGAQSEQDAAIQSATQFDQLLPDGLSTANHVFLCLQSGTETVATNWICLHHNPGASWVYGVEVSERHRGKGFGRAAMIIGEQATLEAGDTHLALNVFGQNAVAIGLYDSMGYRTFDQARSVAL